MVAFSGGADSALLAKVAHDTLGRAQVLCATALSPSLAARRGRRLPGPGPGMGPALGRRAHRRDGRPDLRGQRRRPLRPLQDGPDVGPRPAGRRPSRPGSCSGVNVSDLGDHRPGQAAAAAAGATFPLVEAGFTKDDIRHWSKELGLRTWDKPAAACLASRLPYGTPVTLGRLAGGGRRRDRPCGRSGSAQLRVRHHGAAARLEFESDVLGEVLARRDEVVAAVRAAGFRFVALDLEGFRSGSMNRMLDGRRLVGPVRAPTEENT